MFFAVLQLLAAASILAADRPANVLLIVSDDQGYADLGCIGANPIQTPHLDRLAREGVRLTSFYVAWPACTPSRGALLTGRYPQRNGVSDMIRNEAPDYGHRYDPAEYATTFERIGGMDTRERILPAFLSPAGYRSGIFGKWDLGSLRRFLPLQKGFDEFYGFVNTGIDYYTHERYGVPGMYRDNSPTEADKGTYCTYLFQREAMRFLREQRDQPFFLYVPFNAPHGSSALDPRIRSTVQAPPEFQELYPPVSPETQPLPEYRRYAAGKFTGPVETTTREARARDYRAAVTCMDAAIGEMLDFLDSTGLTENTLVIFFSDNGGSGGADNTPLRGHKSQMWEGGLRVPCVVRWPRKLPAGVVSDAFLTSLEVLPTVLAACGVPLPESLVLDGFDMTPVLAGSVPSPRQEMFWQRRADQAARVGHWKWVQAGQKAGLFDLSADIGETNDLSATRPDMLALLRERFAAWTIAMEQADPRGPFRDY